MEITSRKKYSNIIYNAIVVNADTSSDPEKLGRVQIYIPSLQYDLADKCAAYMASNNKPETDGWSMFPWAYSTIDDLALGTAVFGSNINNKNSEYIIIGLDKNNAYANTNTIGFNIDSALVGGLLDLTMPIIMLNEISLDINDWPDNIPTSKYTSITPEDNGGWSIGIIQWHHTRAFDLLYQICSANGNWLQELINLRITSESTLRNLTLIQDLQNSIKAGTTNVVYNNNPNAYQDDYKPNVNSLDYQVIQALLGSEAGKQIQRKLASADTMSTITMLTSEPNNLCNPAMVIFITDMINQYGSGARQVLKLIEFAKVHNEGTTNDNLFERYKAMFDDFKSNQLLAYFEYKSRRDRVNSYIESLYNAGKLTTLGWDINLVDIEGANQGGQFLWPTPGYNEITSPYGYRIHPIYGDERLHTGIDIGVPSGVDIIAVGNGTVELAEWYGGYGNCVIINHGSGYKSLYGHQSKLNCSAGQTIKAGQTLGYVGSTGNSTGPHLHFEIRINDEPVDPLPYIRKN